MTNELQHHGILGMKWGIRRYQNPDGSLTAAGRKRYGYEDVPQNTQSQQSRPQQQSSAAVVQQPIRTGPKKASEMTDQELRDYLNRVDLERRYNAIINPPKEPTNTQKFLKAAGGILAESVKNVAKAYITKKITDLVFGTAAGKAAQKANDAKDNVDALKNEFKNAFDKQNKALGKAFGEQDKKINMLLEENKNKPAGLLEEPKKKNKKDKKNKSDEEENDDIKVDFFETRIVSNKEMKKREREYNKQMKEQELEYNRQAKEQAKEREEAIKSGRANKFLDPIWDNDADEYLRDPVWDFNSNESSEKSSSGLFDHIMGYANDDSGSSSSSSKVSIFDRDSDNGKSGSGFTSSSYSDTSSFFESKKSTPLSSFFGGNSDNGKFSSGFTPSSYSNASNFMDNYKSTSLSSISGSYKDIDYGAVYDENGERVY